MTQYLYYSTPFRFPSKIKNWKKFADLLSHSLFNRLPPIMRERLLLKLRRYNLGAGLNHNKSHQAKLIIEASTLGRVAVVSPFILSKEHNFGYKIVGDCENFYDLADSYICYRNEAGKEATKPFSYIQSDTFFNSFQTSKKNILTVFYDRAITYKDNKNYQLIIRQGGGLPIRLRMLDKPSCYIVYKEAANVRQIGDQVCKALGDFYTLRYRVPDGRNYKKSLPLSWLDKLVELVPTIYPPGEKLYILSNIWNQPDYFNKLKKIYRVYTYKDFPQLRRFIHSRTPNTFLLFAIERYMATKSQKHYEIRGVGGGGGGGGGAKKIDKGAYLRSK